jgi:transketolase
MNSFGASAPAADLYREFGITTQAVMTAARRAIARHADNPIR